MDSTRTADVSEVLAQAREQHTRFKKTIFGGAVENYPRINDTQQSGVAGRPSKSHITGTTLVDEDIAREVEDAVEMLVTKAKSQCSLDDSQAWLEKHFQEGKHVMSAQATKRLMKRLEAQVEAASASAAALAAEGGSVGPAGDSFTTSRGRTHSQLPRTIATGRVSTGGVSAAPGRDHNPPGHPVKIERSSVSFAGTSNPSSQPLLHRPRPSALQLSGLDASQLSQAMGNTAFSPESPGLARKHSFSQFTHSTSSTLPIPEPPLAHVAHGRRRSSVCSTNLGSPTELVAAQLANASSLPVPTQATTKLPPLVSLSTSAGSPVNMSMGSAQQAHLPRGMLARRTSKLSSDVPKLPSDSQTSMAYGQQPSSVVPIPQIDQVSRSGASFRLRAGTEGGGSWGARGDLSDMEGMASPDQQSPPHRTKSLAELLAVVNAKQGPPHADSRSGPRSDPRGDGLPHNNTGSGYWHTSPFASYPQPPAQLKPISALGLMKSPSKTGTLRKRVTASE